MLPRRPCYYHCVQVSLLLAAAPACALVPVDRRAELFDERVQEVGACVLAQLLGVRMKAYIASVQA